MIDKDKIKSGYKLSSSACLDIGGHCYEDSNYVIDMNPPIYHRVCKHCGWVQEGSRQPSIDWHDDDWENDPDSIKEHNKRAFASFEKTLQEFRE